MRSLQEMSLQDIMNDMARHPEQIMCSDLAGDDDSPKTEIGAFISIDPLLASLYKQNQNAISKHNKLITENGDDDPMAMVAADMVDSTQSAFDTRMIEVKRDQHLSGLARALIEVQNDEEEQESNRQKAMRAARFYLLQEQRNMQEMLEDQRQNVNDIMLFLFFILFRAMFMMDPNQHNIGQAFVPLPAKGLRTDFSTASDSSNA